VSWSVQGPAGGPGQPGQPGSPGAPGNPGPPGPGPTALHFTDTASTASPPPRMIATAGPFTFYEQCEAPGGGAVEGIVTIAGSDPWLAYGTLSQEDISTATGESTRVVTRGLAAGPPGILVDVFTGNNDQWVLAAHYQLIDQTTNRVYDVPISVSAVGINTSCTGIGEAIPAS
jgi:hypothetical protein